MAEYRKKPVVLEAVQYSGDGQLAESTVPWWYMDAEEAGVITYSDEEDEMTIKTLEGRHTASPGDWIIRGVKGELYPCKPDIFALTYEPANLHTPEPGNAPRTAALLEAMLVAHAALNAYRSDGSPEQTEIWHRLLVKRNATYHAFVARVAAITHETPMSDSPTPSSGDTKNDD